MASMKFDSKKKKREEEKAQRKKQKLDQGLTEEENPFAKASFVDGTKAQLDRLASCREHWMTTLRKLDKQICDSSRIERNEGKWDSSRRVVIVEQPKGKQFQRFGVYDRDTRATILLPEEALYMASLNALDVMLNGSKLGLNDCFSLLLDEHCPLHYYTVYAEFCDMGFAVYRHQPRRCVVPKPCPQPCLTKSQQKKARRREKRDNELRKSKKMSSSSGDCNEMANSSTTQVDDEGVPKKDSSPLLTDSMPSSSPTQNVHEASLESVDHEAVGKDGSDQHGVSTGGFLTRISSFFGKILSRVAGSSSPSSSSSSSTHVPQLPPSVEAPFSLPALPSSSSCSSPSSPWAPLVSDIGWETLESTYEALKFIPQRSILDLSLDPSQSKLKVAYDVYRRTDGFRKSSLGDPQYSICVSDFNSEFPSQEELVSLTQSSYPAQLKFAVVSSGTVTYYGLLDFLLPVYTPVVTRPWFSLNAQRDPLDAAKNLSDEEEQEDATTTTNDKL